jgi:16S rRNA (cytosine1402-N4)-methyltransferase
MLLREAGITEVAGLLLDLGVSSHQLDAADRGFSFRADAPLDMRMNAASGETAAELVARSTERELTRILQEYGEERWAARIARFIAEERGRKAITTTAQLASLVSAAIPKPAQPRDTHPATRTFQALRIAVNDELAALEQILQDGAGLLARGGRIAVISYHSLEDRIVKRGIARLTGKCECPPGLPVCRCGSTQVLRTVTRKPITPSEGEIRTNPRARSAKLRVAERV